MTQGKQTSLQEIKKKKKKGGGDWGGGGWEYLRLRNDANEYANIQ